MMHFLRSFVFSTFILLWGSLSNCPANVRVTPTFGDHMVLQRDMPLPIWGEASPGEVVTVAGAGQSISTTTDTEGQWKLQLAPLPVMKEPFVISITGSLGSKITLKDVLVGEVWLCMGQSNMAEPVRTSDTRAEAIAQADMPLLREFDTPKSFSGRPAKTSGGRWKVSTPQTVPAFSATAWYFGQRLQQELGVPVGLINSSIGATRIEQWLPAQGAALNPKLSRITASIQQADAIYVTSKKAVVPQMEAWLKRAQAALAAGREVPDAPAWPQHPLEVSGDGGALWNGMVAPHSPFTIRGVLWYQGEANRGDGMSYFEKMKGLILGIRAIWGRQDLPFYFVQIAPMRYAGAETASPELWEAQARVLTLPHTGMVTTLDIGDLNNIHPTKKRPVGQRLAGLALSRAYGRGGVDSGPLFKSFVIEGNKIRVRFQNVGGGLASRDGAPLSWFTVAGADKKFVPARAEIDGTDVLVWSDTVTQPTVVRFAWSNIAEPNLMNKEGFPAAAFRTDSPAP